MNVQNGYQGSVAQVPSLEDFQRVQRPHQLPEDIFPESIVRHWTPNPENLTLNGAKVAALKDRITCDPDYSLVQATDALRPELITSDPVFGNAPSITFGSDFAHSKILAQGAGNEVPSKFSSVYLFAFNAPVVADTNVRVFSSVARHEELYLDFPNSRYIHYNGGGSAVFSQLDFSYLGPQLLICSPSSVNQTTAAQCYLLLGNGSLYRTTNMNVLSGIGAGRTALGNMADSPNLGAPVKFAEVFHVGRRMSQQDIAKICDRAVEQFGFTKTRTELMIDGDSLSSTDKGWPLSLVLPNTQFRSYASVGGNTLRICKDSFDFNVSTKACPLSSLTRRTYLINASTNDFLALGTCEQALALLSQIIQKAKQAGFTDVVVATCLARGFGAGPMTEKTKYNTELEGTWEARGISKLVNLHTSRSIAGSVCPKELLDCTDLTYFLADQSHLTAAGYVILGNHYQSDLRGIGL
jgi:hypothetical protein